MKLLTFMARRFVAGETAEQAVAAVRRLNAKGIKATLDCLGEECRSLEQAQQAADEVRRLFKLIADNKLDSNVSVKLTQFGFNLDVQKAREHLLSLLEEAERTNNFIRIDMEGSSYTQSTLDLFYDVFKTRKNVGIVIQSMLRRSRKDIEDIIKMGARVRLCKGAYKEPESVAFQSKEEICASYDELTKLLLDSGVVHGIATHDDDRIEAAIRHAAEKGIPKNRFEFQMLYGLRAKRWSELVEQGFTVRVYVPYGTHWFPYFYRRLRERKENVLFVLRNLFS
ncbi:MAG: proline dehydrogenase family protein [Elusimicrobiota bacterium]